jgi:hypothetical protein
MNLELSKIERDKLVSVLGHFIPELRGEIASGVKHDWKVELKKEKEVLSTVLEKLKNLN